MKRLKTIRKTVIRLLFCLNWLFIVGCSPSDGSPVATFSVVVTKQPLAQLQVVSSATLTTTVTPSPLPTETTEPTLTPSLTQTATRHPSPTPSMTPLPTFSPTDAQAVIIDLLENNAGCLLPCWWGVTPGQTQWADIVPFLTALTPRIMKVSSIHGVDVYGVEFYIPEIPNPDFAYLALYYVNPNNGIIDKIKIGLMKQYYILPSLLNSYGQPSEVLISTYQTNVGGPLPFRTVVVYQEQGFAATYETVAVRSGNNLVGCPQQTDHVGLLLSSPQLGINSEDTRTEQNYYPLEEVTNSSLQNFYETYKDIDNTSCLETPMNLWP